MKNVKRSIFFGLTAAVMAQVSVVAETTPEMDPYYATTDWFQRDVDDIAQNITLLADEQLLKSGANHVEDLVKDVPGLTYTAGSARARFFQIRGTGEFDTYEDPVIPAVGFSLDEIDYSGFGNLGAVFDLQQVEVFKGPQAGRFGSSALAGSINLVSNAPTDYQTGNIMLGVGERGLVEFGSAAGGPITEDLSYRISLSYNTFDGDIDNAFLGRDDTNGLQELAVIGQLRWQLNDVTTFDLLGHHFNLNNGYDAFSVNNNQVTTSNNPGQDNLLVNTLGLKGLFTAPDGFDVKTISAITLSESFYSFDSDWQALNDFEYYDREKWALTQEVRLVSDQDADSRLRWAAGAKVRYADETSENVEDYNSYFFRTDRRNEYTDLNSTIFTELGYQLSDVFSVTGALRLENRRFDFVDTDLGTTGLGEVPSGRDLSINEILWGGQLTLEANVSAEHLAYLTFSKGYRGSGFNTDPFNSAAANEKYDDESLYNVELGWKGNPRQDLNYTVNVYYQYRQDAQIRRFGGAPFFEFATENADKAYGYGLESEIFWQAQDNLSLNFGLSVMNARLEDASIDVLNGGRDQAYAPAYKVNFGAHLDVTENVYVRGDFYAIDEHFVDAYHDSQASAYELLNLELGYVQDNWKFSLWVKNVLDQEYVTRGLFFSQIRLEDDGSTGFTDAQLFSQQGLARTVGVRLQYFY